MKFRALPLTITLSVLLSACTATNPKVPTLENSSVPNLQVIEKQAKEARAITDKVTETIGHATARVVEATGNAEIASDPTLVPFEKMNAKLTTATEQQVRALVAGLVIAKQVIVIGYCDRSEVGNAVAAAKARAEAVQKVLIDNGISPKRIIVQFDTTKKLHAVRVKFNG